MKIDVFKYHINYENRRETGNVPVVRDRSCRVGLDDVGDEVRG